LDQIPPCIHDELALFLKKYRRVVKDNTKVTKNCQNPPSSSACVSQDNVLEKMNFLDSYGFTEDKNLKGLLKFYICGGASHIGVECANNHMTDDDFNKYITSSNEKANHFALAVFVHNSSLTRVHVINEGEFDSVNESKSGDDRQDDQSYRELCENFNETCNFKEQNHMLEQKVKELDELNETLKMTKMKLSDILYENEVDMHELYHKVSTLEKENSNLIKKLNYLSLTRPDITYEVSVTSQFMHSPSEDHMAAVMRILSYLKSAPGRGLLFKKNGNLDLEGYTDADYEGNITDKHSTSGYFTFVGGNLVTWRSKKQNVVSRSSTESEYRGIAQWVCEILCMRWLLAEIGFRLDVATKLHCDGQSAFEIANNLVQHDRTKHVEVDRHFIKEKLEHKFISIPFVPSLEQIADMLTHAVSKRRFEISLNSWALPISMHQ
ncbi:unnamed protein product, partial [Prunus brigantina]